METHSQDPPSPLTVGQTLDLAATISDAAAVAAVFTEAVCRGLAHPSDWVDVLTRYAHDPVEARRALLPEPIRGTA